jgi:hypothetical protein
MMEPPILPGQEQGSTNRELQTMAAIASWLMPKTSKNLEGLRALFALLLSYTSTPISCFLRWEHGERSLSELRVLNTLFAMQILWFLTSAASALMQQIIGASSFAGMIDVKPSGIGISPVFQIAFIIVATCHLLRINYRRRKGGELARWDSLSSGISIFQTIGLDDLANSLIERITLFGRWKIPFRVEHWFIFLYVEPAVGFLAADIIHRFDAPTGVLVFAGSLSLLIESRMIQVSQRHILLDHIDSEIRAENLRDAAYQKPPSETAGVMVIPGFAQLFDEAEDLDIASRVRKTFSSDEDGRPGDASRVN